MKAGRGNVLETVSHEERRMLRMKTSTTFLVDNDGAARSLARHHDADLSSLSHVSGRAKRSALVAERKGRRSVRRFGQAKNSFLAELESCALSFALGGVMFGADVPITETQACWRS